LKATRFESSDDFLFLFLKKEREEHRHNLHIRQHAKQNQKFK